MSDAAVRTERQLRGGLLDAYTATRRFLIRGKRQPDVIFGSLLTPVIFVVLFGYVFGSSIVVPGGNYRSYLMPGLFAMSVLFSAANVAVAVATDMSEGVVDRFRTLPIARSAIIIGRSLSTLLLGIPVLVVMIVCGLAVGWRPEDGLGNAVLAFLLFELFGFAIGWLGILVGLLAGSAAGGRRHHQHPDLPDGLHLQRLRRPRHDARLAAGDRLLEPDVGAGDGGAAALRQHHRAAALGGLVAGASRSRPPSAWRW